MTYAQALSTAKETILKNAEQIRVDQESIQRQAEQIRQQSAEISQREVEAEGLREELAGETRRANQLSNDLSAERTGREQAEATCGRQHVQIEQMQQKAIELQDVIDEQESVVDAMRKQVSELMAELESVRSKLPTEADIAALAEMNELLGVNVTMEEKVEDSKSVQATAMQDAPAAEPANEPVIESRKERKSVFCFRQAA